MSILKAVESVPLQLLQRPPESVYITLKFKTTTEGDVFGFTQINATKLREEGLSGAKYFDELSKFQIDNADFLYYP